MSQWAEIRHLHLVDGLPKKEIARRLKLDIKTVRRAVDQQTAPVRMSRQRANSLDPWREQIEQWPHQDRRLTAKRLRRLPRPCRPRDRAASFRADRARPEHRRRRSCEGCAAPTGGCL